MAKKPAPLVPRPAHQEIAERARAIFEQSGRVPGRDVENWLQAEAELLAAAASKAGARPARMPATRPPSTNQ